MKRTTLVLLLLVFGARVRPAAADTIGPADVLRVAFSLPAPPQCVGGCDVILFGFALANNPVGPTSASLFNGSTSLGTFRTDTECQMAGTCAAGVPSFIAQDSVNRTLQCSESLLLSCIQHQFSKLRGLLYVSEHDRSTRCTARHIHR